MSDACTAGAAQAACPFSRPDGYAPGAMVDLCDGVRASSIWAPGRESVAVEPTDAGGEPMLKVGIYKWTWREEPDDVAYRAISIGPVQLLREQAVAMRERSRPAFWRSRKLFRPVERISYRSNSNRACTFRCIRLSSQVWRVVIAFVEVRVAGNFATSRPIGLKLLERDTSSGKA
ncbi:hypothetical protein [Burkholderia ambifaria]